MDNYISKIEGHMQFICPECGLELTTQAAWRKHLNNVHNYNKKTVDIFNFTEINERYHECNECLKWVANGKQSISTLQYHRISHLPYNLTFKCRHCGKGFARKKALSEHLLNEHRGRVINTNASESLEVNVLQATGQPSMSDSQQFNVKDRNECRKETSDIIQLALLGSIIDLENEETTEPIISDFDDTMTLPPHVLNLYDEVDVEDSDYLEEICADVFEEVLDTMQNVNKCEPTFISNAVDSSINDKNFCDTNYESDEKIISLEINAVNEADIFASPKRKRLRIEKGPTLKLGDEKMSLLLETYIVYLCPECGREFQAHGAWRDHVFKVHDLTNTVFANFKLLRDGISYLCLTCRLVLHAGKVHELQRHRFTHMPFQSYLKCTFCGKTKSSKSKVMHHLQECHANTLESLLAEPDGFKCTDCDRLFSSRMQWRSHRHLCSRVASNASALNISNNRNLIAHLREVRVRMKALKHEL